jgi:hypothetical protein
MMPNFRLGGSKARERLEKIYPIGTRIELQSLCNYEPDMPMGLRGTVVGHDDQPALLMLFDNNSTLNLFPSEDNFRILSPEEVVDEQEEEIDGGHQMGGY